MPSFPPIRSRSGSLGWSGAGTLPLCVHFSGLRFYFWGHCASAILRMRIYWIEKFTIRHSVNPRVKLCTAYPRVLWFSPLRCEVDSGLSSQSAGCPGRPGMQNYKLFSLSVHNVLIGCCRPLRSVGCGLAGCVGEGPTL